MAWRDLIHHRRSLDNTLLEFCMLFKSVRHLGLLLMMTLPGLMLFYGKKRAHTL